MNTLCKFVLLVSFCLCLVSCATQPKVPEPRPINTNAVQCKEPRPQICTREYRPVCATINNDVKCGKEPCDSTSQKTYATGCTACADSRVSSYVLGQCKE